MQDSKFVFESHSFDQATGTARFDYMVALNDATTYHFSETVVFPSTGNIIPKPFMDMLHLVLGISYWKAFCSRKISTKPEHFTPAQARCWKTVYEKGLGEFFFRNNIDYRGLISFPSSDTAAIDPATVSTKRHALLGIGGGKDSIVAGELLKKAGHPFSAFVLETQTPYPLIDAVIDIMDVPKIYVKRTIDPQLFELNRSGQVFNGHIPVSAIYACIGIATAALFGYSSVVVPNEHSANVGNVEYLGTIVNHQWSKSYEFERLLRDYVRDYVSPDIQYISVLRPLTELKIASHMVDYPAYFKAFSSCNNNFKLLAEHKKATGSLWCGVCPKCAFVFAILCAFMPVHDVSAIFGKNLFTDIALIPLYRELLGLTEIKPFECVGTFEETQAALCMVHARGDADGTPVMQLFMKEMFPKISDPQALVALQLTPDKNIRLSGDFADFVQYL